MLKEILRLRNTIHTEQLFSSTTYKTNSFDRCIYCHKNVENDYYEYKGELVGMPYRCSCNKAKEELKAKEFLLETLVKLRRDVDIETINKTTKEALIEEIDRAYREKSEDILKYR
jgi:hypothetical protein